MYVFEQFLQFGLCPNIHSRTEGMEPSSHPLPKEKLHFLNSVFCCKERENIWLGWRWSKGVVQGMRLPNRQPRQQVRITGSPSLLLVRHSAAGKPNQPMPFIDASRCVPPHQHRLLDRSSMPLLISTAAPILSQLTTHPH